MFQTNSHELRNHFIHVLENAGQVVVGQKILLERMMIALLSDGHILLEGLPGLAKTLSIRTLANLMHSEFARIQFTPDLLPSDVMGTMILEPKTSEFLVKKGPIFANLVLADEINRAPAKVQSALLEAMAEKQVTLGDQSYVLPEPFCVLATQNPLEQEGTYPLPEAQLDRFLFKVRVQYPTQAEELEILNRMSGFAMPELKPVCESSAILQARLECEKIFIDEKVKKYIVDLVHATRAPKEMGFEDLGRWIEVGASPRATLALARSARALSFLRGKSFVSPEEIRSLIYDVFRHRLILSFEAEAESQTPETVIAKILQSVEVP